MKLHELKVQARVSRKRVGRGISSGQGKTAGRGTKGQRARAGGRPRPGFEGGQNPLIHRLPKQKGFTSHRVAHQIIHTDQLNRFDNGQQVTANSLKQAGLIRRIDPPIKLLLRGKLTKSLKIELNGVSAAARKMVEAQGGTIKVVSVKQAIAKRPQSKPRVKE
ncbi:50S ribosomal protein L15 [Candidatus Microgenomates bacterium]|nr:50S ribosomal protein L15 [Candidatus Microgenomates bacterium]